MRKKILSVCIIVVFIISLCFFANAGNLFSETIEFRLPFVGATTINTGSPYHTGVSSEALDFGLAYGQEVYAAGDGKIIPPTSYGDNYGFGNLVKIEHPNGYTSIYAHLSEIVVSVGDSVKSGQLIGRVGNSGNVYPKPTSENPQAGKHLHFEIRNTSGQSINISSLAKGISGLTAVGPPLVEPTYYVSGYIYTSDGKSCFNLTGVDVEIPNIGKVKTDSNGIFKVDGLKKGAYTITPSKGGYSFSPSFKRVDLSNSINDLNFEATLLKVNLAPNPSFEEGSGTPSGWQPHRFTFNYSTDGKNYTEMYYKADIIWDKGNAHSGNCSLNISNLGGGHVADWETIDLIPINYGIPYKLSVWIKESSEWYGKNYEGIRNQLNLEGDIRVIITAFPYDSGGKLINYPFGVTTNCFPTLSWTELSTPIELPPGTAKVKIGFEAWEQTGYLHKNSVWFDDVYFGPAGS